MSKMLIDDIINQFRILFDKDIEPGEEGEKVFEKLIAYLMTCKYASDYNFDIQDICSGQSKGTPGSERSIDSAAVIIDGIVVPNVEYLEEKYKDNIRSVADKLLYYAKEAKDADAIAKYTNA